MSRLAAHIPPSEQPLQFQSKYYLNKPRIAKFRSFSTNKTGGVPGYQT